MSTYTYTVSATTVSDTMTFKVGFGSPAQNDEIVKDAAASLESLGEIGGRLALINGPGEHVPMAGNGPREHLALCRPEATRAIEQEFRPRIRALAGPAEEGMRGAA